MENRERRIKSWKEEALAIFNMMLKECEAVEAYEQCVKIKANMDYIRDLPLTIREENLHMPYPYQTTEDEESIFIEFGTREVLMNDEDIDKLIDDLNKEKPKRRKKKKDDGEAN